MSYKTILYTLKSGILTLSLNRPDKLNAVTDTMISELKDSFKKAARDSEVRVVVLTGEGRGFCAGQDLGSVGEENRLSFGDHLRKTYNPLILQMQALQKPIIAAINGVAAGAGMSLVLACDIKIASDKASFIQAFVRIGLVPDSGSTWILPRLIGTTRAMEMMLTGRKVSAEEALEWGMINAVVPADDLADTVNEWAGQLATAPTKAIGYIKRSLAYASNHPLDATLEYEADMQELAGRSRDHAEGVAAFVEKRSANFTGE